MTRLAIVAMLALCVSGLHAQDAAERPLRLSELAYSIPLRPIADKPVLRVLVPKDVYAGVRSADLSDLRVFNDDGEQVPFAIRTLDDAREVDGGDLALPHFPLRAADGEPPTLEGLSVAVEGGAASARIDLRALLAPEPAPDAGPPPPVSAHLLDATDLERPIAALRIDLEAREPDYVLPIVVESSDDLASFHHVEGGTLVDLEYGGARITRNRIELDGARGPFLRLTTRGGVDWPGDVRAVHAELEREHEPAPRVTTSVRGVERKDEPGVYDFDLGGFVPADRARVQLPQDNALVQATLSSSKTPDDDGSAVFSGTLYRIVRDGERLESPAIDFGRRSHRHWTLRVEAKGGGLGSAVPRLELSRHPDQLLVMNRGRAPFHLAYGHHAAGPARFSPEQVLDLMPERDREHHEDDARAGPRETRAGQRALSPPPPPPPYKRYLLWAVLIAGALGLGISALRMLRS